MRTWIKIRKTLLEFYSGYEVWIKALLKFAVAFLTLWYLCRTMGYMEALNPAALLVIIAAFCSFLPSNALILAAAVYLEGHLAGCSLSAGALGALILVLMLLLYFCFIPDQAYVTVLTALAVSLRIPCALPVVCGLVMGPGAVVGIAFGTCVRHFTAFLAQSGRQEEVLGTELLNKMMDTLGGLFLQREMILDLVVLAAVFLVVFLIRRLPVRYCRQTGIACGILVYVLLTVMGNTLLGMDTAWPQLASDALLGMLAGTLVWMFGFLPDYRKTEYLQFEDDDYYYYVKAVPKLDLCDGEEEKEKGDYKK